MIPNAAGKTKLLCALSASTALVSAAALIPAVALVGMAAPARAAAPSAEQLEFFEKEIRPLLVKHCFECHGDLEKIQGGLRLTSRSSILAGGESGPAAAPGKPDQSLMVEAVRWKGIEMPPNGKLPEADVKKLARWIEMDLPWPGGDQDAPEPAATAEFKITDEQRAHWAFQPVRAVAPPPVASGAWPAGDVDRFVLSKLEARGLAPNGPAERRALLRRVTYDLIGLPPTPEETAAFVADTSAEAWSKVVERLLASPQYGERWGRHWLDVVRYADTAGEVGDHPVPDAYKYRNYVIQAFNADKPYDEFLREQIAGDMLAAASPPEKYAERMIGTGFLAISHRYGGNDSNHLEFHLTIADTLDTLGRAVMGLSIGCARCHDHKFEPISNRDYYALYGIFSSSTFTFPGTEEVQRPHHRVPLIPAAEAERLLAEARQQAEPLAAEVRRLTDLDKNAAAEILAAAGGPLGDGDLESQVLSAPLSVPWAGDPPTMIVAEAQSAFTNVFAAGTRGIRLPNEVVNVGASRDVPEHNSASTDTVYLNIDFRNVGVQAGGDGKYRLALAHQGVWSTAVELNVDGKSIYLRNGAELEKLADLTLGAWYNLQIAADFGAKSFSGRLYGAGQATAFADKHFKPDWDGTVNRLLVDAPDPAGGARPQRDIDNLAVGSAPFAAAESAGPPPGAPSLARDPVALAQVLELRGQLIAARKALPEAQAKQSQAERRLVYQPPFETAYGVVEGKVANTRIQKRGEPERLGEEVPRRFLELFGGDPVPAEPQESGRRQLADWLTRPSNPLTARVMANRIWQHHFGRGLVPTPSDFGLRGQPATHPELLDFLAARFMEEGWSVKRLQRLILLSRTYQMSSADRADALAADPKNELLWRVDRQRLDAESIRDAMLALSGQLDPSPGGAHPFPPIDNWGFTSHNPFKDVYGSNRRSVYLMTQRFQRHPFLGLFDGANPEISTDLRVMTTTPTQALYMMNNPFVHEQAAAFAKRMLGLEGDDGLRVRRAHELAYARPATPQEEQSALAFIGRYRDRLAALGVPAAEQAGGAWGAYLQLLLTSNEFLFID